MDDIYLDHAASTPMPPAVRARLLEVLADPRLAANAAAEHGPGRAVRAVIEAARAELAAAIGARPVDIVFTSGATEADNLALGGTLAAAPAGRRRLVTLTTEHKAVLDTAKALGRAGTPLTLLTPDSDGRLRPEVLAAALGPDVALVSVMFVNNETGVVQDLAAFAPLVHAAGALLHSDCAQALGKLPVDVAALGLDLASFSAHKAGGPQGVGALWRRAGVVLAPQSHGGGQEQGLRPGTLPTALIAAFGRAAGLAVADLAAEHERLAGLRARLAARLLALGEVYENGAAAHGVPHILNLSFGGVHGESLRAALDGLAVSGGSACNAQHSEPSAVLRALGRDPALAGASLRFSLGRTTTLAEIEAAAARVEQALARLRPLAPPPAGG